MMQDKIQEAVRQIGQVVLGKEKQIKLALCCLFSGGHLLLEDKPGMGKTTLSQALAKVFGLAYSRIQFTSDLLPADILGTTVYDPKEASFRFHAGPIFNNLILADEINRTTPKTQSALLEAMEERQVTVDGETRPLPEPFFVIATQNPISFSGTYPLPESQLDRFLMRLELGYPDFQAERALLSGTDPKQGIHQLGQSLGPEEISEMSTLIPQVKATDALLDYVQRLINFTREHEEFPAGLSPRGGIALIRCARTWALMDGRQHVLPEDVQTVLPAVVDHRLRGSSEDGHSGSSYSQRLQSQVDIFGP